MKKTGTSAWIYLIRHGDTKLNEQNRVRGQEDVPLTFPGRKQARAVAKEIAEKEPCPVVVFTDDMKRSSDTANFVGSACKAPVNVQKDLRPWDLGDLAGKRSEDARPEIKKLVAHPDTVPPKGEPYRFFLTRFYRALKHIMDAAEKRQAAVAVIVHGSTERAVLALYGRDGANSAKDPTEPGDWMELEYHAGKWRLE